jgi:hypothetical protein
MGSPAVDSEFRIHIPAPPGGVRTDFSTWPVSVITPPANVMSDADYRAYLDWSRRYIVCVGRPYAMVLDTRNVAPVPATQRKILADHMASTREYSARYCAGVAMIYDSIVMRGVMTAIFWLVSPAYPTAVFASLDQGKDWCQTQLEVFTGGLTRRVG